jgi:flagellar motor switch protein FliG
MSDETKSQEQTQSTAGPRPKGSDTPLDVWQPRRLSTRSAESPLPMTVTTPEEGEQRFAAGRWQAASRPGSLRKKDGPAKTVTVSAEPIAPDDSIEQMAAKRPEDIARAIQTVRLSATKEAQADAIERIAILIIGLGSDLSAPILKHCDWDEVEDITQAVIEIRMVLPERRKAVFEEFRQLLLSGDYILTGGPEYAQRMLQRAFPREWVGRLHNLMRTASSPYSLFSEIDPRYLVPFIAKEHPQTIALILSQLDTSQSAAILTRLDSELQQDVAYRLATLDHVPLQTLRRLEDVLASDLRTILSDQAAEFGGPGIVAKILNQTSRETEDNIMSGFEDRSTDLAEAVRDRSFIFEDIQNLQDSEIKLVLTETDPNDLILALKATGSSLKDVLLNSLEDDERKRLQKKVEKSDRTRRADAEAAQERIAQTVRNLNEQGKVRIVHGDAAAQFL